MEDTVQKPRNVIRSSPVREELGAIQVYLELARQGGRLLDQMEHSGTCSPIPTRNQALRSVHYREDADREIQAQRNTKQAFGDCVKVPTQKQTHTQRDLNSMLIQYHCHPPLYQLDGMLYGCDMVAMLGWLTPSQQ